MLSSKDEAREMAVKGLEALASQCSDSQAVETLMKVKNLYYKNVFLAQAFLLAFFGQDEICGIAGGFLSF